MPCESLGLRIQELSVPGEAGVGGIQGFDPLVWPISASCNHSTSQIWGNLQAGGDALNIETAAVWWALFLARHLYLSTGSCLVASAVLGSVRSSEQGAGSLLVLGDRLRDSAV